MKKCWDTLWINATIVSCHEHPSLLKEAALAVKDGKIAWVGSMKELSAAPHLLADILYDAQGNCITPGLIDCHTHLVYAGNRANEFEMRLRGISYQEIADQGAGIQSTVNATRAASEEELLAQSLKRAHALMLSGVTTLEIKSGYGLDLETELKLLKVAKRIEKLLPLTIYNTFLGAHAVAKEFNHNADAYIDYVCNEMIPMVAEEKLASAVDVFCEKIAFNLQQTERVFLAAKKYNLAIKCHAEQLSDSSCAELAAKYRALSVDHLEFISEAGIKAIAASNTTAVLLPGAFYFLRETQLPPIHLLRHYQVPLAIASDCNPGTSPMLSLPLIMNMACTLFRMTPDEALMGVTYHAAKALGIDKTHGSLALNKAADFAIWDIKHPAELSYYAPNIFLKQLVKNGVVIH